MTEPSTTPNTVIFISGVNDAGLAKISLDKKGKLNTSADGSANVFPFVQLGGFKAHRLIVAAQDRLSIKMPRPSVIFNELASPETHKKALVVASNIIGQFDDVPVINRVDQIMETYRDKVYQNLKDIAGIVFPKTIRIAPVDRDDLAAVIEKEFSTARILIRETGTHGGETVSLWSSDQPHSQLDRYAIDGREFYITQFIDFRSADGFYRKFRIAVIDGVPYLRHVLADDGWNIHASARNKMIDKFPNLVEQELVQLNEFDANLKPDIEQRIGLIHQALGLDFFGIDCGFDENGNLIIFEANASMNILINTDPSPSTMNQPLINIRKAMHQAILSRLAATTNLTS